MINTFEGKAEPSDGRFAIVVARFNQSITARLLDGAVRTLVAHGIPDDRIDVAWAPGAFEIPTVASRIADGGRHVAILCLGAVIRGETPHDEHINRAVSIALAQLGVDYELPILFGVLTCNTLEQAIARSGGESTPDKSSSIKDDGKRHVGNKGVDCALAALEMVSLMAKLPRG